MQFFKVGGSVRDMYLNRRAKDVDFVAVLDAQDALCDNEDTPYQVMERFLVERGFEVLTRTPHMGTLRARHHGWQFGGERIRGVIDFVVARKDIGIGDGRHPSCIEFGTLHDDLARRDFTINAMAIDSTGTIIDPFDGAGDIQRRKIRCVGDPLARFQEDALRVLRALRFALTLDFNLDSATALGLRAFVKTPGWLEPVSIDRVREEMLRMFKQDTDHALGWLEAFEITSAVFSRGLWLKPTLEDR